MKISISLDRKTREQLLRDKAECERDIADLQSALAFVPASSILGRLSIVANIKRLTKKVDRIECLLSVGTEDITDNTEIYTETDDDINIS